MRRATLSLIVNTDLVDELNADEIRHRLGGTINKKNTGKHSCNEV